MGLTKITHSSHSGHFLLLKYPQEPYKCEGCKELGFGPMLRMRARRLQLLSSRGMRKCYSICFPFIFEVQLEISLPELRKELKRTLITEDGKRLHLKEKPPSKCLNCRSSITSNGIKGWSYVSSCGQYCYHVACVKDMVLENWRNGYFNQDGNVNEANYYRALQSSIPNRE
ncbi:CYSTEINE/HISTIDINE-RICH C1 DOMAIN FAMILY PROTEIN [Salix purpurea]|uniref:CYSTEINE/HISTIDINE-RICH C1 DOMAIN FAMILY PROTEIN n=1 Tax=Salix purpurea TaxID=77065 RepID=A0A9Q0TUE0_SALPP|nr:CYSTEINE/HISTIDINE-RICH C1 DOMAIN FAMILY PROTEIN [Salix purpurea]